MKPLVYLSHPSGGLSDNTKDIEKCIRLMYQNKEIYNKITIVSPVHCYGFMYNDDWTTYDESLQFCLDLLYKCDLMIVIGDYTKSKGCQKEIKTCTKLNIPYMCIENSKCIENDIESISKKIDELIEFLPGHIKDF